VELYWSCGAMYSGSEIDNAGGAWCTCLLVNSPTDNLKSVYQTKSSFNVGYTFLESGALRKFSFDDVFVSGTWQ
jgi:hypothetical protein